MRSVLSCRPGAVAFPLGLLSLLLAFGSACGPVPRTGGTTASALGPAHAPEPASEGHPVRRWPAGTALVVAVEGLTEADSTAVFRALAAWLADDPGSLSVRPAAPGEPASVVVRGVDRIEAGHDARGRTEVDWVGRSLVRARVQLARFARCGEPIPDRERDRAIAHETGHVLGLAHSERRGSIMYRHATAVRIGADDRTTLNRLYTSPVAASSTAVSRAP